MKPLKGAHLVLNEKVLSFLTDALDDIEMNYSDAMHDERPGDVLKGLSMGGEGLNCEWGIEEDKFGKKCFTVAEYGSDNGIGSELRVTVVLTKKNELKLDIRCWGEY